MPGHPTLPRPTHAVAVERGYRRMERAIAALKQLDREIDGPMAVADEAGLLDDIQDDLDAIDAKLTATLAALGAELDRINGETAR